MEAFDKLKGDGCLLVVTNSSLTIKGDFIYIYGRSDNYLPFKFESYDWR